MNKSITSFSPIGDSDKIQQILKAIQDYIIGGDLEHGTELPPERVLASHLGVSRFSLREALRVAQAQGLIEIARGRRPRVRKPSAEAAATVIALALRRSGNALLELIEARQGLETQIARLAALRANEAHISKLKNTIETIEANRGNPEICVEEDIKFHNTLVEATRNIVFEIMLIPLAELMKDSRKQTIQEGIDKVLDGHKAILSAIELKDQEKAASAMQDHLRTAETYLRKITKNKKNSTKIP